VIAEFAGFGGAAGRVGLGVEVEDDGFALEGGELEGVAGFVGEFEVGCFAAYFECHMFPLDAREVGGFINIEPHWAEPDGEAGAVAGGDGLLAGIWGGPFDILEHVGVGGAGGDGVIAAVFGGAEGDVFGAFEQGLEVGDGDGGDVATEN